MLNDDRLNCELKKSYRTAAGCQTVDRCLLTFRIMKKLLTTLLASCMLISATAQSVTTASSSMTASPWAQQVPFNIADEGQQFNFATGMGGWSDIQFAYKQRNWVGKHAKVARLNFFGRNNTSGVMATELSEEQLRKGITFSFPDGTSGSHNGIDTDLDIIAPSGVKDILLLCDMDMRVRLSASDWNNTNRVNYYVNDIALAVEYLESKGYNVLSAAPFNEPDFDAIGNCGKSASVFNKVAAAMQQHPTLKGRVCGPNTLNTDPAVEWYATIKNNVDIINTHQLAGSFEHLVEFWDTGIAAGKQAVADEMHNVMEAMVVMNHGGHYGTWWGYDGVARAEFARVTSAGRQLAYEEDAPSLTVAGVYRYDGDAGMDANRVKAIIGTSERQALAKSYTFVSQDRLAYYDGYGPTHDYTQDAPGGAKGSYQNGQTNAERVLNVYTGEDVPVEPVDGLYKIVNKKSGKVLSTRGGGLSNAVRIAQYGEGAVNNQEWSVRPVHLTVGGDYSYHFITNANTSGNTYYLDDLDWSLHERQEVIAYPGGGSGCEQWHLRYVGDGYYTIINRHSGLCLEVLDGNTADGAGVVQMMVDESDEQLWKFLPVDHSIDATAPTTPTGLAATPQSGAVKLTWAPNSDADVYGYMVYRYNATAGIWECIGRKVRGTAFLDNTCRKGQPLRYRIRALDEVYNLSEPSAELQAQTTSSNAMIAQWTGLSHKDNTPNKMHAVAYGTTSATDANRPAISFDGADDYLKLPYHAGDMEAMTFTAWVKGSSTTAWQRIFDFGNGEDEYLFLTPTNGSAMRFEIKKNGTIQGLNATTTLGTGTWKHVAVTIGPNEVTIYINGVKNASTTDITLRPSDIAPTISYLGRSQFVADPAFKGMMSDVRLYNYALTADEVKTVCEETVSTEGLDITAERIPNIADNVDNWSYTGKWATWASTTEDATNLTSPYVRTTGTGISNLTKTLAYLPEGQYKLKANVYAYYNSYISTRKVQQLFMNDQTLTINSERNRTATLRELKGSVASDNQLEFGIKITSSSSATNTAMDNVKLLYQGTAADYIEGIEIITFGVTAEAATLRGKPMNATVSEALEAALDRVNAALATYTENISNGTSTPSDVSAWVDALDNLANSGVVADAKASVAAYVALGSQITASRTKATLYPQETCGSIDEFGLDAIYTKYINGEYLDSEIPAAVIEVKGITNRYLMADAVAYGSASNPVDVSAFIVEQAGFDNDVYAPWQASPTPGVAYGSIEFYNTNFTLSQVLYGMPAGTYRLQTRAFYRYGDQPTNYTAHNNGTLQRNAKLYISHSEGTQTADIMAISDDPSEVHAWGAWSSQLYNGNPVPDNMQAASEAIDVRGKYQPKNGYNSVEITVSDMGDLTIGAKKEVLVGADWTFFGDFSLYYLGDGKHRIVLDEKSVEAPKIDESISYDEVFLKRTMRSVIHDDSDTIAWNTFVSPFDMSIPEGWEVKELKSSKISYTPTDTILSLMFAPIDGDVMIAGMPYMVRDLKKREYKVFTAKEDVELSATPGTKETEFVDFVGVYYRQTLPQGAFFINNNTFYRVKKNSTNWSSGYRAYLMPKDDALKARALSYRTDGVVDEDDNGTSVGSATGGVTVVAIYNTQGERLTDLQDGINILQMSDGTTMKVVIR